MSQGSQLSPPPLPVEEVVQNTESTFALNHAGNWRRFGGFLIDDLCYLTGFVAVCFVIGLLFGQAAVDAIDGVKSFILTLGMRTCYYIFFEGLWGRTPGKFLLGTIAVTEQGKRIPLSQVVGRTFSRFIPFDALSFLFDERGWHDSLSKTHVVRMVRQK